MAVVLICASDAFTAQLHGTLLWRNGIERHVVHKFSQNLVRGLRARPSLVLMDRNFTAPLPFIAELRTGVATQRAAIAIVSGAPDPDLVEEEANWIAAGAHAILRLPAGPEWDDRLSHLMDVPMRRDERLPVRLEFTARSGVETVLGIVHDLSVRGMLVECALPLALGAELDFWLGVAVPAAPVVGRGKVVRVSAPGRYGVEFSRLDEDGRERMRRFLDTGGAPPADA